MEWMGEGREPPGLSVEMGEMWIGGNREKNWADTAEKEENLHYIHIHNHNNK